MKIILGNFWQQTVQGDSVTITQAVSDPVPTCTLLLHDNTSAISVSGMPELLIIDENKIANPTVNIVSDPVMNTTGMAAPWSSAAPTGATATLNNPGGKIVVTNVASGTYPGVFSHYTMPATAGQSYMFSFFVQGSSSPTSFGAYAQMLFNDAAGTTLSTTTITGAVPASTSNVRLSGSATAPAGTYAVTLKLGINVTNNTNSGAITYTNVQCEPMWFPTQTYPTPFCGPNQANCIVQPFGLYWLRQYRKFAGFVTHAVAQDYHGNVRTVQIDAVGYAWLASQFTVNDSFTNFTDASIITSLTNKYLIASTILNALGGFTLFTLTNVVTGVTLTDFGANWDDIRTLFDNLAALSGFYWTVDANWNLIYAPPGYNTMPISLICDNSSQPDNVTTFPAYAFSAEQDYTQPGNSILVIGSGSNVALVEDPNAPQQLLTSAGMAFQPGSFVRKINDSTLQSVTDCTNRGQAELIQYDYPRGLYHLTTQAELIAGQGIAVTSATDNLNKTVLLIQQVSAKWIGTQETLTDVWEYQADLGATNKHVASILSRLFRIANKNTSAPAVSTTTLAVFEKEAITGESITTSGSLISNYFAAVQLDAPQALYPFNEIAGGTIADDYSGNANQGTGGGGITEGATGLLIDAADSSATAWTFNGTSGIVTLPASLNGNGLSAISIEIWQSLSTSTPGARAIFASTPGTNTIGYQMYWASNTSIGFEIGNGTTGVQANFTHTATSGETLYCVGTYDGANVRFYVNGILRATTAQTGNISASAAPTIGAYTGSTNFYPGTLQYGAVYSATLSALQVATHYLAGTSLYGYQVMLDTPLAYYRLDEASGTTATDVSSNGNNGTYTGGFTLSQTGALFNDPDKAVLLNGTTGFITTTSALNGNGFTAITVEGWFNLSTTSLGSFTILAHANNAANQGWQLFWNGTTSLQWNVGNGTSSATASYTVSPVASTWWHIVGTYDGSNVRLYVNGQPQGTTPALSGTITAAGTPVIGATESHSLFFPGTIDEFAVYKNVALSAARIQAHYNMGTLGHL